MIKETPHIEIGNDAIDLEFEKNQNAAIKKVVRALLGKKIKDSAGNIIQLKTQKQKDEFIDQIANHPTLKKYITEVLEYVELNRLAGV